MYCKYHKHNEWEQEKTAPTATDVDNDDDDDYGNQGTNIIKNPIKQFHGTIHHYFQQQQISFAKSNRQLVFKLNDQSTSKAWYSEWLQIPQHST